MRSILVPVLLLATAPASAQIGPRVLPSPPQMVCVPVSLLQQMGTYMAGQPWRDVAVALNDFQRIMAKPAPCELPKDIPPVPPSAPTTIPPTPDEH